MPTYQYACTACGEPLEVVQKFSDDPLTECPACGGALRKVFSAVGVVFKGSGFYKTDSRASSSSSGSGSGSGAAKPEAKPDAKPAADAPAASSDKPSTPPSTGTAAAKAG